MSAYASVSPSFSTSLIKSMERLHSTHTYPLLEFGSHCAAETKTNGVGTSLGTEGGGLRKMKES